MICWDVAGSLQVGVHRCGGALYCRRGLPAVWTSTTGMHLHQSRLKAMLTLLVPSQAEGSFIPRGVAVQLAAKLANKQPEESLMQSGQYAVEQ